MLRLFRDATLSKPGPSSFLLLLPLLGGWTSFGMRVGWMNAMVDGRWL